jgi:hypothetical protein
MDYYNPHEDEWTSGLQYEKDRQELRDSFTSSGDTHFGMSLEQYQEKFVESGFEQVLKDDFQHNHCGRERTDSYYVYAHRDGFLLTFDTYTSDYGEKEGFGKPSVNVAHLHYNFQPTGGHMPGSLVSSGTYVRYPEEGEANPPPPVWAGYHDVREGLNHIMSQLKAAGVVMNPWLKNDIAWLAAQTSVRDRDRAVEGVEAHQSDWVRWKGEIHDRSTKNFNALPDWVRQMLVTAPD